MSNIGEHIHIGMEIMMKVDRPFDKMSDICYIIKMAIL